MDDLGFGADRAKNIAFWAAEKAGRLKLNGQLTGYSPLSRLIELEGLVTRDQRQVVALAGAARGRPEQPRLDADRLERLLERGEEQLQTVEELRTRAARDAFVGMARAPAPAELNSVRSCALRTRHCTPAVAGGCHHRRPCREAQEAEGRRTAWSEAHVRRLFWRAGFGATPREARHWARRGKAAHDPLGAERRTLPGPAASRPRASRARPLDPMNEWGHDVLWWLDRMVRSRRPLQEKLTLFWHDHFATTDQDTPLMLAQNQTLRRHALGHLPRRCCARSRATRRCCCSSRSPTPTRRRRTRTTRAS